MKSYLISKLSNDKVDLYRFPIDVNRSTMVNKWFRIAKLNNDYIHFLFTVKRPYTYGQPLEYTYHIVLCGPSTGRCHAVLLNYTPTNASNECQCIKFRISRNNNDNKPYLDVYFSAGTESTNSITYVFSFMATSNISNATGRLQVTALTPYEVPEQLESNMAPEIDVDVYHDISYSNDFNLIILDSSKLITKYPQLSGVTDPEPWVKALWGNEINTNGFYKIVIGSVRLFMVKFDGLSYGYVELYNYNANLQQKYISMTLNSGTWTTFNVGNMVNNLNTVGYYNAIPTTSGLNTCNYYRCGKTVHLASRHNIALTSLDQLIFENLPKPKYETYVTVDITYGSSNFVLGIGICKIKTNGSLVMSGFKQGEMITDGTIWTVTFGNIVYLTIDD